MELKKAPIINDYYIDGSGKKYDIKSTVFDPQNQGFLEFVAETTAFNSSNSSYDEVYDSGVYLYKSLANPKIGYRIYRQYNTYRFDSFWDCRLIQNLQKLQKDIKRTEFPMGVITLEDSRIIGQLVPFYDNSPTIYDYSMNPKNANKNPIKLYINVLKALAEMSNAGITYFDNHSRNFLIVNEEKSEIKTIDFDYFFVNFDTKCNEPLIFTKFLNMVNFCNENLGIKEKAGTFKSVNNYSDAESQLLEMNDNLSHK